MDVSADSTLLSSLGISIGEKIEVKVGTVQEQQTRMIVGTIEEIANTVPRSASPTGRTGYDPNDPAEVSSHKGHGFRA